MNDEPKTEELIKRRSEVVTELQRLTNKQSALITFLRVTDRKISESTKQATKPTSKNGDE